ncbi:Protease production enhancer protein [Jannaschia seosinensis]|uniref:Protease production enhancer protein n=1 Tax=Jannaschia seosinensis TaxID=313367 RepID=A0A0M7BE25_9RHOB|nr:response regulator transcription factor [Jannaschia seosinensis]CUH40074.1 Protease production enhancer protein [Jannaschia seosinensis]
MFSLTPQVAELLEKELNIRCMRFPTLEAADEADQDLSDLELVLVDERMAADLLNRPEAYKALNPAATIALSYRRPEIVRTFFRAVGFPWQEQIGYLCVGASIEVLVSSVKMLLHGEVFLPKCLLENLCGEAEASAAIDPPPHGKDSACVAEARLASLTLREREVLELLAEGNSNKMIARALGIAENTVKLHVHNLTGKFGVTNRTAAARIFLHAKRAIADARG